MFYKDIFLALFIGIVTVVASFILYSNLVKNIVNKNRRKSFLSEDFEGERIRIPVSALDFNVGSNTIWIHSGDGSGTVLRIKCTGKIITNQCETNPVSHCDIMVDGDINFCLSGDIK